MITIDSLTATVAGMVAGLWLAAAVIATIAGLRRAGRASAAEREARGMAALLAGAPAIPLLVAADGRIEGDARLADWLGLPKLPKYLAELSSDANGGIGVTAEDVAAIEKDATAVHRAGRSFSRAVRVRNSGRALRVVGRPTPAEDGMGRGRAVLWFFDASDSEGEIARLGDESIRLTKALEALAALIEAAPFPMWHRGPDLRLALVNGAYVRAVEARDAGDVVSRGVELVDGEGGGGPLSAAAAARDSHEPLVRTAPATIGGARRMIRIVDVPLGEAGVAGYAVDIEELEEARADLSRFARAQRDMLDHLSAGVAQFSVDRSLVFSNQPFQRMFAMQPDWLLDRPEFDRVLERMREAGRLPESRDFPGWKAERRRWFTAVDEPIDESWLLPGGLHLRVLAQPLPDGGLLLVFEDRTEQVQLASARDTLLRVRTATFDNLFEAVSVFAADGRLHLWNSRFRDVWGLSEAELSTHPRVDMLVEGVSRRLANPHHAGLIRELVRIATSERQQRSGRVAFADGRHFEFAAVPLPDGNALFTMLDITDSRRIERALRDRNEALEETDKLKSQFVENMSYELRTPLTSIGGFAEMLAGGYAGDLAPIAVDYVSAILESVTRLSELIDGVLDLTQVEAGSLPIADEIVEINPLITEAVEGMRAAAAARPLDVIVKIAPKIGAVNGDARRLRQALDHLLRNAVGYTQAGGRVLVHAKGDPDEVQIVISDNGPGIPETDRERVFTRFHRGARVSSDGKPRAGLGLPLTRQFVEAHGGTLTLMSQEDAGTTLVIRLPRRRP